MASLFQLPKAVPVSAGNSYVSAKLYFYRPGTTTPITTYTTSALSVPHANPVVADANGVFAPIYIDGNQGSYRIQLKTSADSLIYDVDNIPAATQYEAGNVKAYGARGDNSTDDTAAINSAIAACISSKAPIYFPAGTYLVTSTLTTIPGSLSVIGDGSLQTTIRFAPTANDTLFYISNGAERVAHFTMQGLRLYSSDTTYTKIAIDAEDMSVCHFDDIYIHGTGGTGAVSGIAWSGGTSVGLRTSGREACSFYRMTIMADRPVHITANPNTAANDGEDVDHWHFRDCYLGATSGNYIIYVDDGLGVINLTFDGYQAWIGGDGGFRMKDTRAAPTVPSRHIAFYNVRGEQGFNTSGYWFNIVSTVPIQQLVFDNCLGSNGTNGITINAVQRCSLRNTTMATTTGTSFAVAGATDASVIDMIGCNWQNGSTFTTTGYTPTMIQHYNASGNAGPSTASYVSIRTDTAINVALVTATSANGSTGLRVTGTTGDRIDVQPQAAGSGVQLRALNNAGSDFEPAAIRAETLDVLTRTGAATVASAFQVDANGTAGNTRMLVYDVDNAQVERVSVGAADSGGAGFKVLRIPN